MLSQARVFSDGSDLVFPFPHKRGAVFARPMLRALLDKLGLVDRMTVHGCRATFRTAALGDCLTCWVVAWRVARFPRSFPARFLSAVFPPPRFRIPGFQSGRCGMVAFLNLLILLHCGDSRDVVYGTGHPALQIDEPDRRWRE